MTSPPILPLPDDGLGLDAELQSLMDEQDDHARAEFDGLHQRVLERLLGDAQSIAQAREAGGFLLNGRTVVLRWHADTDTIECFCDVGEPEPHSRDSLYRTALEINLCRTHRGLILGVHPESGRVVATLALPRLLVADEEALVSQLEMLTLRVGYLRDSRALALVDY